MTTYTAPGKSYRKGLTLIDLMNMFPTEEAATEWFESVLWPTGRCCGKCGSVATREVPNSRPMPYWCTDCRNYFSVRTGNADCPIERPSSQVGHRHLPVPDQPEKCEQHEAAPGHWCFAAYRLVHAASDSSSVGYRL